MTERIRYKGLDAQGQPCEGVLQAPTLEAARLRLLGLQVREIEVDGIGDGEHRDLDLRVVARRPPRADGPRHPPWRAPGPHASIRGRLEALAEIALGKGDAVTTLEGGPKRGERRPIICAHRRRPGRGQLRLQRLPC